MNATQEPSALGPTPTNAQQEAAQARALRESLLRDQRLGIALLTGSFAAVVAAVLWAAITLYSGYQIGWMAIGVGFLVGITIRYFGRGVDRAFAVTGAALALLGCALGNAFVALGILSRQDAAPFIAVFSELELRILWDISTANFRPMDLLFYVIAAYEGYKLSYRQLPPSARPPAPV